MTTDYCEPAWHDGAVVPAAWRIRAAERSSGPYDTTVVSALPPVPWDALRMFTCCSDHLSRAVREMLAHHQAVVVTPGRSS